MNININGYFFNNSIQVHFYSFYAIHSVNHISSSRLEKSVIGWVTKIYYLELFRAEARYDKPLGPAASAVVNNHSILKKGHVRQAADRKNNSLSQLDEKYVILTPLSGIRIGK
jgi:hypothetical protein